jgi:hypothetical protein
MKATGSSRIMSAYMDPSDVSWPVLMKGAVVTTIDGGEAGGSAGGELTVVEGEGRAVEEHTDHLAMESQHS